MHDHDTDACAWCVCTLATHVHVCVHVACPYVCEAMGMRSVATMLEWVERRAREGDCVIFSNN